MTQPDSTLATGPAPSAPGSAAAARAGSPAAWWRAGRRARGGRAAARAPTPSIQPAAITSRGRGSTPARPSAADAARARPARVGSAWARAPSIMRPKGTPLGHAASQARQARHSSIIVRERGVDRRRAPSSTARMAAMRPRGEAVSRPVRRKVGQWGRQSPHATHLTTSSSSGRRARGVPVEAHAHSSIRRVEDAGGVERVAQAPHQVHAGRRGPPGVGAQGVGAVDDHRVPAELERPRRARGRRRRPTPPPPGRCPRPSAPRSRGRRPPGARPARRGAAAGRPASTSPAPPGSAGRRRQRGEALGRDARRPAGPASSTATPAGREQHRRSGAPGPVRARSRGREPLVERALQRRTSPRRRAAARASGSPARSPRACRASPPPGGGMS